MARYKITFFFESNAEDEAEVREMLETFIFTHKGIVDAILVEDGVLFNGIDQIIIEKEKKEGKDDEDEFGDLSCGYCPSNR
jgi:hypothetical protein